MPQGFPQSIPCPRVLHDQRVVDTPTSRIETLHHPVWDDLIGAGD